jgi:aromatic-L-amino-acid decarboxylase
MIKGFFMDIDEFRKNAHEIVDWIADYYENIEQYPVKSQVSPKEILNKLPENPPEKSEDFGKIFSDFEKIIMPGITHWQSPNFFAYFPANASFPSILGEFLTAALGTQCMIWETSPAAAELEQRTTEWLRQLTGLPEYFHGVIQDTASTATLCSLLTAREKKSAYRINEKGSYQDIYRVYCSDQAHSSIEKDVKIAGIGRENLVKIHVDKNFAMIPGALEEAITNDLIMGYKPLAVVTALGTTGSTAVDPLNRIGKICKRFDVWLHVDAAYAGSALVLEEMRWMAKGMKYVDTFVFNPHKWMFTNFDCSAYYVKDKEALLKTFEIMPEYLKTERDQVVNNYRDWGIQLGRRFRALKLWFVIRSFGAEGIKSIIRKHIEIIKNLTEEIEEHKDFEILAPVFFNLICFRFAPQGFDNEKLNEMNQKIMQKANATGDLYLTHTKLNDKFTLRFVAGQTCVEQHHVRKAWDMIRYISAEVLEEYENK